MGSLFAANRIDTKRKENEREERASAREMTRARSWPGQPFLDVIIYARERSITREKYIESRTRGGKKKKEKKNNAREKQILADLASYREDSMFNLGTRGTRGKRVSRKRGAKSSRITQQHELFVPR